MFVSLFNKPCFFPPLHTGLDSIARRQRCESFTDRFSCLLFLTFSRGPLLLRRGRIRQRRRAEEGGGREEGSDESSPSLQALDVNQINYVAATVSQLRRGNEMIRGNDAEQVNEIINYPVIYWESLALARTQANTFTHFSSQTSPTAARICFN